MLLFILNAGNPAETVHGPGPLLPLGLNLDASETPSVVFINGTDAWAPTWTEDAVDTVDVDTTDDFYPIFSATGQIQLNVNRQVDLTSQLLTATAGAITVRFGASVTLVKVRGDGEASNFVTVTGTANVFPTYALGTLTQGTLVTQTSKSVSVTLVGVVATGTADDVTIPQAVAFPTTARGTGVVGTVGVVTSSDVSVAIDVTPMAASVGVLIAPNVAALITSVSATSHIVSLTVQAAKHVDALPLAARASGSAGEFSVTGDASVPITGTSGTGEVNAPTQFTAIDVAVTGASGSGEIGTLALIGNAVVSVTGVGATGSVGLVLINPGSEGSTIRRDFIVRGSRTVRVAR